MNPSNRCAPQFIQCLNDVSQVPPAVRTWVCKPHSGCWYRPLTSRVHTYTCLHSTKTTLNVLTCACVHTYVSLRPRSDSIVPLVVGLEPLVPPVVIVLALSPL